MFTAKHSLHLVLVSILWTTMAHAVLNEHGQQMTKAEEQALAEKYRKINLQADLTNPKSLLGTFGFAKLKGGDISGGGSTVRFPGGQRFLLDFATLDRNFVEKRETLTNEEPLHRGDWSPEEVINGAPINLKFVMPKTYALYEERLKLWEKNSPILVTAIRKTVEQTSWRATVLGFMHNKEYELPEGVQRQDVILDTLSLVLRGYGVFINERSWSRAIGLTSRSGLIIHEALRSLRVEISERLSNKTLQILTAHLMLTDPAGKASGFLDDLFLSEMWSEESWIRSSAPINADYIKTLCDRGDALVKLGKWAEQRAPLFEGWSDSHARDHLVRLDQEVRSKGFSAINRALREIKPPIANESLSQIPQRTLSFWLDHFNSAVSLKMSGSFPLEMIGEIPAGQFKSDASLMARPYWGLLRERLENLQTQVCGNLTVDPLLLRDYVLAARTVMANAANSMTKVDQYTFYWNFSNFGNLGNPRGEKFSEYLDQVIRDARGARLCPSPHSPNSVITLGDGPSLGESANCKPIPKKYFLNGVPALPRIGSK